LESQLDLTGFHNLSGLSRISVAVLLAPIALNTAYDLGVSPYPLMMAVAVSASAAFLSPVGHSANVLIMGPGGYRFAD
jgi:di/tricarboxylate transporter